MIRLACDGIPIVLCDRYVNDYHFSHVGSAHDQLLYEIVAHLKEGGFEKVAFFTQEYDTNSVRYLRRNAYLNAMAEFYPDLDEESMRYVININDMLSATQLTKNY